MAIKINNNTVIDDSQNITNIGDITASGTVNGGIIATTAEAQAGSSDSVIMTPLKVKEAIQGGNISVIKTIQRFTLTATGSFGTFYSLTKSVSSSPGGATIASTGEDYVFIDLPITVNISKSFLTISTSGVIQSDIIIGSTVAGEVNFGARLYNTGGGYAGNQVQIISKTGSDNMYIRPSGFEIYVEVVEFY